MDSQNQIPETSADAGLSSSSSPTFRTFMQFYHRQARESSGVGEGGIGIGIDPFELNEVGFISEMEEDEEGEEPDARPMVVMDTIPEEEEEEGEDVPIGEMESLLKALGESGNCGGGGGSGAGLKLNVDISEIRKLFDCPVCYEVILPPITLCQGGHSVCNPCKENLESCPSCRGPFTQIRDRFAEEFLDKCLVTCRFQESGCPEMLSGTELGAHVKVCNYRPLLCRGCHCDIPHHQFLTHLVVQEHLEIFVGPRCATGYFIRDEEFITTPRAEPGSGWEPIWIHAFGHHFFCFIENLTSQWWFWVGAFASPEQCQKFICSIALFSKEVRKEANYVGSVHPLRASPEEVRKSGLCLQLNEVQVQEVMDNGKIRLLVQIDTVGKDSNSKTGIGRMVDSPWELFWR